MSQDTQAQTLGQDVIARLKQLRTQIYGQRGLSEFARELGLSPATYRRYEKDKVPPVELLAKVAKLAGTELAWLITGRKTDGQSQLNIPPDRLDLLARIEELAQRNPATLRALQRFMDLLEQQTTAPPAVRPPDPRQRSGWLPVLGRSAAGVVFFWKDLPDAAGKKPAERLSELIDAYLQAQTTGDWPGSIQRADADLADQPADIVSLIQVNVPSDAAVAEFLDCPVVGNDHTQDAATVRYLGCVADRKILQLRVEAMEVES